MPAKTVSIKDFRRMKESGTPIVALTAYEALFASIMDEAGVDLILVGDSLANVFQGRPTTIPVTLDQMIYHGEIVARSVSHAFVIVDLPFLSFQVNADDAVRNAGEVMKRTLCSGVKLEGGVAVAGTVRRLVDTGIPVLGHVGLTPQSVHVFGGFALRGRDDRQKVIDDAVAVQDAGAFAVVLEKIPKDLAAEITKKLSIPTIGIGAGPDCDGQILVTPDMLGLFTQYKPAFVRRYAELAGESSNGIRRFIEDVRSRNFPSDSESYQ